MEREDGLAAALPSRRSLGRKVAVDVLVEAAVPRAAVAAPGAVLEVAALMDVGRPGVLVLGILARVGALDGVTPIRPHAERKVVHGADVEVVARERHGAVGELLVVRVGRDVADPGRSPARPEVGRACSPGIERGYRRAVG